MGKVNWNKTGNFITRSNTDIGNEFTPERPQTNDSRDFFRALSQIESSGQYGAHTKGSSFYGKYQMGEDVLKDAKIFAKDKKICVQDMLDYMKDPFGQENAALKEFSGFDAQNSKYGFVESALSAKGIDLSENIGKEFTVKFESGAPDQKIKITEATISAAAHNLGQNGLAKVLAKVINGEKVNDSKEGADGNGISFTAYMQLTQDYSIDDILDIDSKEAYLNKLTDLIRTNKDKVTEYLKKNHAGKNSCIVENSIKKNFKGAEKNIGLLAKMYG